MKYKELTTKPAGEIKQMLQELRAKLHDLSTKARLNQLKNGHEIAGIKKDIARIMTFLSPKKS